MKRPYDLPLMVWSVSHHNTLGGPYEIRRREDNTFDIREAFEGGSHTWDEVSGAYVQAEFCVNPECELFQRSAEDK